MEPVQDKRRYDSTLDQLEAERFGRPKLIASLERIVDYVTTDESGGAHALAQLLMSCYDGREYPFDITELCRLDDDYHEDALNVIRLRTHFNEEPHVFFVERNRLFEQIASDHGIQPISRTEAHD